MIRNDTLDRYSSNWECFITLLLSGEMERERERGCKERCHTRAKKIQTSRAMYSTA